MDNDVDIEPKTRYSTSVSEAGKVNKPRDNATET